MTQTNYFETLADLEGRYEVTDTGCHEWNGNRYAGGYGRVSVHGMPGMPVKRLRAHRLAWFLATGTWPPVVRHYVCDNPPCVNVQHLRAGTSKDNHDDMVRKRRNYIIPAQPGEKHPRVKLSDNQVRDMRNEYDAGNVTYADMGRKYGVSRNQARNLCLGRTRALEEA